MSVRPEQQAAVLPERAVDQDEELFFAAASIIRQMARSATGPAVREFSVNQRGYRLEGRRLETSTESTGPIVLVFVEQVPPPVPDEDVLQKRFGFTRREAKVARLIAEGLSNEEVAVELSISPHTARHHTERVLGKLEVKSRIRVKAALLNG